MRDVSAYQGRLPDRRPFQRDRFSRTAYLLLGEAGSTLSQPPRGVQRRRPHIVEKAPELGQAVRAGPVQPAGAVAALVQQRGVLEHGEVLAHRCPAHVERGGDLPRGQLVVRDQPQDLAPPRFGEGLQGPVDQLHSPTVFPSGSANKAIRP